MYESADLLGWVSAVQGSVHDIMGKGAPVPPAATMGIQAAQILGDGVHFVYRYGTETCDLFRIAGAKVLAQALEIEDVANEGDDRFSVDKVAVKHAQETAELDLLPCLFGDFPEERLLDHFSAFNAARGQSIYWLFVTVLGVQKDFAAELADGKDHLAPKVWVFTPPIGAHVVVGLDVVLSAEWLTVFLGKGLDFSSVDSRRYG